MTKEEHLLQIIKENQAKVNRIFDAVDFGKVCMTAELTTDMNEFFLDSNSPLRNFKEAQYPPWAHEKFPLIGYLYNFCMKLRITWDYDEQQAEHIEDDCTIEGIKKELELLLQHWKETK